MDSHGVRHLTKCTEESGVVTWVWTLPIVMEVVHLRLWLQTVQFSESIILCFTYFSIQTKKKIL